MGSSRFICLRVFFVLCPLTVSGWLQHPGIARSHPTTLFAGVETSTSSAQSENSLRKELSDRTSKVDNEKQYAVPDGALLESLDGEYSKGDQPLETNTKGSLEAVIKRMTKPRAYPLFIAEKIFEFAEVALADVMKMLPKDDESLDPSVSSTTRDRIVILGTGWGAMSFLKGIDTDRYEVVVVSPRNYFTFTPMLAGASVGTVEFRSICEPVREINRKANYLEATATRVHREDKTIECQSVVCEGNSCKIEDFSIPYDRLVVTVGAQTNTFGIPGVLEHCCFLKEVDDARKIRTAIVNCFERANLPGLTDDEQSSTLTFAIIGAGPTGIETAAELRDFLQEDGPRYYPNLLRFVSIKVIEASSTVLAPFDKSLQEEAIRQLKTRFNVKDPEVKKLVPEDYRLTELLLDSSVKEVSEDAITLNNGDTISYGIAIWAAGNGPNPLTLQLVEDLGPEQAAEQNTARGRIAVDPWMRAIGSEGTIIAFGDCSCVPSGQLPATAQVASQQGEYVASLLNARCNFSPELSLEGILPPPTKADGVPRTLSDRIAAFAVNNGDYAKPFQFLNLGILAYTGQGSALAQVSTTPSAPPVKGTGKVGNLLWRSVYLSKQVSWRNRLLVLNDWTKRRLFGRDITRI